MKKNMFFLLAAMTLATAMSQNIAIRFTGLKVTDSTYMRLDSVRVENVSRNWTEVLTHPDTVLILDPTTGIAKTSGLGAELKAYPNPFNGRTTLDVQLAESDNVALHIYDLAGRKVAEYSQKMGAGAYLFDVSLKSPQVHLAVVSTSHGKHTVKLVNHKNGSNNSVSLKGMKCTAKRLSTKTWRPGDTLAFHGYSNFRRNVITSRPVRNAPREDTTFSLYMIPLPSVTTDSVTNISDTSATCSGEVTDDGGDTVTARGICWGTSRNPTIDNNPHTSDGSGTGTFTSLLTNLQAGTFYYVRAYATNYSGTSYGEQVRFKTYELPSVVSSNRITLTMTTAVCGGEVTDDGGTAIISRGICYSRNPNPTIADSTVADSTNGTGGYTCLITGLTEGTKYYFRAYATNSVGTAYGVEYAFTTVPEGGIFSLFSVSPDQQVRFSKGNLQWSATGGGTAITNHTVAGGGTARGSWRFAEHQYDTIGAGNHNVGSSYAGWIDVFGWGTSGYNGKHPYMTDLVNSRYGNGSTDISGTNYDWGVYNAISNGGDRPGHWRTLTDAEWGYLLWDRTDANLKYGLARVNNINGVVILPDDWTLPNNVTFNSGSGGFNLNVYNTADWQLMEAAGAVFLPAGGYRNITIISYVNSSGQYWSSSYLNTNNAYYFYFDATNVYSSNYDFRYDGRTVRLVQDF